MTLFITLLPVYLFGNLHCLGMCGPLVAMIGQHRLRNWYLAGRFFSYTMTAGMAGALGAVIYLFLKEYYLSELLSFSLGIFMLALGVFQFKGQKWNIKFTSLLNAKWSRQMASLMLQDRRETLFLFGFLTVLLPCGQTLLVFSACAIQGDFLAGTFNGAAFAFLTSPSLALAMKSSSIFKNIKKYYAQFVGMSAILVGCLAICRGLADFGWISHWVLNPEAPNYYHIVIF